MIDLSFSLYDLEFFLLILVRVSCFMFVAPFFSMAHTPARIRIGLSLLISIMVYQMLPSNTVEYSTVFMFAVIVIKEALTGLLIGYAAAICVSVVNFAGSIVDMDMGFSMVSMFDPITKDNVTINGVYYQYVLLMLLMISGLYQYILSALVETFSLIPINGAVFESDNMLSAMGTFFVDYISIGFRLALPVFCGILLLNAILGILARISPQLNMFAVGIQLKVLTGLGILFITVSILPGASTLILDEIKKMVTVFAEAIQ